MPRHASVEPVLPFGLHLAGRRHCRRPVCSSGRCPRAKPTAPTAPSRARPPISSSFPARRRRSRRSRELCNDAARADRGARRRHRLYGWRGADPRRARALARADEPHPGNRSGESAGARAAQRHHRRSCRTPSRRSACSIRPILQASGNRRSAATSRSAPAARARSSTGRRSATCWRSRRCSRTAKSSTRARRP